MLLPIILVAIISFSCSTNLNKKSTPATESTPKLIYRTGSFQGTVDAPVPCREQIKLFETNMTVPKTLIDLCAKKLEVFGWINNSILLVNNIEQKDLQAFDIEANELYPITPVVPPEFRDYASHFIESGPLIAKLVAVAEPKLLEEVVKRGMFPQDIWMSDSFIDLIAVTRGGCALYSFDRLSKQIKEKFVVPSGWDITDVLEEQELCMRFLNLDVGIYTLSDYPRGRNYETFVVRFDNSNTRKISETIRGVWFANNDIVGYVIIDSKEYKNRLAIFNVKNGTTKEIPLEGRFGGSGTTGLYSFSRNSNKLIYTALAEENWPLDAKRCGLTLYILDMQTEKSTPIEQIGCGTKDYVYDVYWSK